MNLNSLIENCGNVQIVISPLALKEAFLEWAEEALKKNIPQQEKYLTQKETAERLGVDVSTLWRWNRDGYLKKCRVGSKVRYRLSDIKKLMGGR